MTDNNLLMEINRSIKTTNRNIMRLSNIGLLALLAKAAEKVKECGNEKSKVLVKMGLVLVIVVEGLLFVDEIMEYKRDKLEQEVNE